MNPAEQQTWKHQMLSNAVEAIAASDELRRILILKGARALYLRLERDDRASLDLDFNLTSSFAVEKQALGARSQFLQPLFHRALSSWFRENEANRFHVESVEVTAKSPLHPLGWDGMDVVVKIGDRRNPKGRGVPNRLNFDLAAPEMLGPRAVSELRVGQQVVNAYSLERIAGEKARAFLSSLPAHCDKLQRSRRAPRVKDLYDLARIVERHSIVDEVFWREAASEFTLACESRAVDCSGITTFTQDLETTRIDYDRSAVIPKSVDFTRAWTAVDSIVALWTRIGVFPLNFPLPEPVQR